ELSADHQALLVRERDVDALRQGDDRRTEAGGADDRVEDEVGIRGGDQLAEPRLAGEDLPAPLLRGSLGGLRIGPRPRPPPAATPCSRAWPSSGSQPEPAERPATCRPSPAPTTSSAWVPIEPVDPSISTRFTAAQCRWDPFTNRVARRLRLPSTLA